jgi:hypothetical protein
MMADSADVFQPGDRVEWIGPEDPNEPDLPHLGERGTVVICDPPDEWVVDFDVAGSAVFAGGHLRRVTED